MDWGFDDIDNNDDSVGNKNEPGCPASLIYPYKNVPFCIFLFLFA